MPSNLHVADWFELVTPDQLKHKYPLTAKAKATAERGIEDILKVIRRQDGRLIICVGPCSFHSVQAAFEYIRLLAPLAELYRDRLIIVLRAFFEKPRSETGWEGMLEDPYMDESFDMNEGLDRTREILLYANEMGLPAVTEVVDPIVHQHYDDVISLAMIGARTGASPIHRRLSSLVSVPIGMKNDTHGDIEVAMSGMVNVSKRHGVRGQIGNGRVGGFKSSGNPDSMLVLRGGQKGAVTNYDARSIRAASRALKQKKLPSRVMVDCNHDNSGKDHVVQAKVWRQLIDQMDEVYDELGGIMVESNIKEGNQPFELGVTDPKTLDPEQSVTDQCIGWSLTKALLAATYGARR